MKNTRNRHMTAVRVRIRPQAKEQILVRRTSGTAAAEIVGEAMRAIAALKNAKNGTTK